MVRHRNSLNLTVCPWAVWEVKIQVHQHRGLLILDALDVVGVVNLAISYSRAVFAEVLVRCSCHHTHHNATVKQFLHVWAWLCHTLGGNVCHNLVLLVLGEHRLRVGKVDDIVVERLNEIVV